MNSIIKDFANLDQYQKRVLWYTGSACLLLLTYYFYPTMIKHFQDKKVQKRYPMAGEKKRGMGIK